MFLAVAVAAVSAQVGAAMVAIGFSYGQDGPPSPDGVVVAAARELGDTRTAALPAAGNPAATGALSALRESGGGLGYSIPVRLTVERVGIDTGLMTLGMNPDGTVQVPPDDPDAPAGWYRNLASPGEIGPAVFLGHVDAHGGRAVFYPLGLTRPGDRVEVRRADGRTVAFTVDKVASYPRAEFPTAEVYGATGYAGLRLVTCGGDYDKSLGGYQENVVVYASLAQDQGAQDQEAQDEGEGT